MCSSSSIVNMVQLGSHVVSHYVAQPPVLPASPAEITPPGRQGALSVLFTTRNTTTRNLLNAAELVQLCQQSTLYTNKNYRDLECRASSLNNLTGTISALQSVDVLIGVHGAGMANAWFMRPGSIIIEITPMAAQRFPYAEITAEDPASRLKWWNVFICSEVLSEPSMYEEQLIGPRSRWALDSHVRLPWSALKTVLGQATAATWEEYVSAQQANQNSFYLTDAGLQRGSPTSPRFHCPKPSADLPAVHEKVRQQPLPTPAWPTGSGKPWHALLGAELASSRLGGATLTWHPLPWALTIVCCGCLPAGHTWLCGPLC